MKIKTSELKAFKANAAFIKPNTLLPILGYLKFEEGAITKNNLSAFLVQKVGGITEPLLVDEKILMNFINVTLAPEIEIKVKDKRVTISDDDTKVSFPLEDISAFPATSQDHDGITELDINVLCAIKNASSFIFPEDLMPVKCHVFVGKKTVAGSNGFVMYLESFKQDLPEIILRKETAQAITKFDAVDFSQSESYHFFESGNCKYGFIKPDAKFVDLTAFGAFDKKSLLNFSTAKSDIIRFNEMCTSSTPSKLVLASFEIGGGHLKLSMQDTDYEVNVNKEIITDGKMDGSFFFNPALMTQLLNNLPDENLTFYQSADKYYITGDSDFTSLIMKCVQ